MAPAVKEVTPCGGYVPSILFGNGARGTLNMEEFLDFGVFRGVRDPEAFKRARVAFDTVEWDCGADLDPEFVYAKTVKTLPAE
jgi:hypothetical protein